MKVTIWFVAALALFFLFCAVATPDYEPGQRFDQPPTHGGRTLTDQERNTIERAIDNIAPPPEFIMYEDENGNMYVASCWEIAYDLICQLHEGRMEAETIATGNWTKPDGKEEPEGDEMNLDSGLVAAAGQADSNMRSLEGVLVHEWVHKTQDSTALRDTSGREIAPYSAMHAYYCSTGVDCTGDDWLPRWAADQLERKEKEYDENRLVRDDIARRVGDHYVFVRCDTVPGGLDSLMSIHISGSHRHTYPLFPMRGSDLYIFESHPFLPPGHSLAAVCGGIPASGVARILMLDMFQGEVLGPVLHHDFGPPMLPPMFFFSMERSYMPQFWHVVDTVNHQILLMQDAMYGDGVPDEIIGVFASANWPGFEPLHRMLGLDMAIHPFMGPGLLVNFSEVHHYDLLMPYDTQFFLMDTDGNLQADLMMPLPLYQFLQFRPVIQVPRPWAGESWVNLHATWEHDIAVWSTDESGEMMIEQLGMMHMAPGIDAECLLSRPLMAGEYVMALDMQTDKRSAPKQVIDPAPHELTICLQPDGVLHMEWLPVSGAGAYALWSSDDGVNFFDTGLRTPENHFEMPLPPMERQFFRVTALR